MVRLPKLWMRSSDRCFLKDASACNSTCPVESKQQRTLRLRQLEMSCSLWDDSRDTVFTSNSLSLSVFFFLSDTIQVPRMRKAWSRDCFSFSFSVSVRRTST